MDIKKLVLVMVFFTSGLFLWEEWQAGQHKSTAPQVATTASKVAQGTAGSDSKFEEDGAPVPGAHCPARHRLRWARRSAPPRRAYALHRGDGLRTRPRGEGGRPAVAGADP